MNFDQIMKLIDAGFTKDEIMGFSAQNPGNAPEPATAPTQEPATAPTQEPKPATAPTQEPKPADDMSAVLAAIKATNDNITKLALMQGVKNIPTQETADDILPQFIRV